MAIAELRDVTKRYERGHEHVDALRGVSAAFEAGQFSAVVGPSGAGKSTLLHILGGLDRPTSGEVLLDGRALSSLDDDALTGVRRDRVGVVFQSFNLLPGLSAWENVALPHLLAGRRLRDHRDEAVALLARVGLDHRRDHRPRELSGGEMQRVAVARALANAPALVLADEPTGNLDTRTGQEILALLADVAADDGRSVVMVTHDLDAAGRADRVLAMVDGQVVGDGPPARALAPRRPRPARPARPVRAGR